MGDGLLTENAGSAIRQTCTPANACFVDLPTPGDLSGADAVARLREMDPHAKVVVMSGDAANPLLAAAGQRGLNGTLRKPFTMEELSEVLQRC